MIRCLSFLIIWLVGLFNGQAQENPQFWGLKMHGGSIWAHSPDLVPQAYSHPFIAQLEWSRIALSDNAWDNCNCYSKLGVSFQYINFNNPKVLGNGYALVGFTEPFITYQNRLYFTLRAGLGPIFLDNVYDAQSNPENLFFSAPVSFVLLLNLAANYQLSPNWHLNATMHYNHISNGGVRLPNKGINYPTIGLGVDYVFRPVTLTSRPKDRDFERGWNPYVGTFFSPRTAKSDETDKGYEGWMVGLNAGAVKQVGPFNGVGLGVELSHDWSLANRLKEAPVADGPVIGSVMLLHYLMFGKFSFSQQMGIYAYRDYPSSSDFFQRYLLSYNTSGGWIFGTSLKAHGHVAEHIDVHIGRWLNR